MFTSGIRKLVFSCLMIAFSLLARAQQSRFIYLQTDNGHPFYTKFNGKLISSSAEGYVILSGVTDGDYQFTVGFPKNELPEETFKINVDKNNEGFLIKNFDEKGLQLFNLQTLALIKGTENNAIAANAPKDQDAFSVALAGAVKDPSILQNHEGVGITSAVPIVAGGAVAVAAANSSKPALNSESETGIPAKLATGDSVSKIMSTQNEDGLQMTYEDKTDSSADTVRILIPVEKRQPDSGVVKSMVTESNPSGIAVVPAVGASAVVASEGIAANTADPNKIREGIGPNQDSVAKNGVAGASSVDTSANIQPVIVTDTVVHNLSETQFSVLPKEVTSSKNSDCKAFATDNDFLKLRGKMAEESDNSKMIQVAKKYFIKKCYSTAQIKNLSYIFLTNETKYQFLEVAYPFVSDADQYSELEGQFTDVYYLSRFKALVGK